MQATSNSAHRLEAVVSDREAWGMLGWLCAASLAPLLLLGCRAGHAAMSCPKRADPPGDLGVMVSAVPGCGAVGETPRYETAAEIFRVDSIRYVHSRTVIDQQRTFATLGEGRRIGPGDPCGAVLTLRSVNHAVTLRPGEEIRYARRHDVRNPEEDVSLTEALWSTSGPLLYLVAKDTRPEVWQSQLTGLRLAVANGGRGYCSWAEHELLAIELKAADGRCVVKNDETTRCSLWGRPYLVTVLHAWRKVSPDRGFGTPPEVQISFTITDATRARSAEQAVKTSTSE